MSSPFTRGVKLVGRRKPKSDLQKATKETKEERFLRAASSVPLAMGRDGDRVEPVPTNSNGELDAALAISGQEAPTRCSFVLFVSFCD